MLRSKTLPLCRRALFYQPHRLLSARSQPSPESGLPSQEPTPNTEESTVRTTESQAEVNVDKQNAGTKGRKSSRKSKKQFTLAIPGKLSKVIGLYVCNRLKVWPFQSNFLSPTTRVTLGTPLISKKYHIRFLNVL